MLYYDGIDKSEGFGVAKSDNSKELIIFHYCFFNHGFKFQNSVCNGCHDLAMLYLNFSSIVVITVKDVDYHCIIYGITK